MAPFEGKSPQAATSGGPVPSAQSSENLVITNEGGVYTIRFNRPKKKNAILPEVSIGSTQTCSHQSVASCCNLAEMYPGICSLLLCPCFYLPLPLPSPPLPSTPLPSLPPSTLPPPLHSPPLQMYDDIRTALDQAAKDPSVRVAVTTGTGDYYCSGNDLSNFTNIPADGPEKMAEEGRIRLGWEGMLAYIPLKCIEVTHLANTFRLSYLETRAMK